MSFLPETQFLFVIGTGVLAFMVQYAGIIWRISKAESNIYDKINAVEHNYELELQKLKQEILETKLLMSNDYMHRDTFKDVMSNIDARLIRLESKLDHALELSSVIYKYKQEE